MLDQQLPAAYDYIQGHWTPGADPLVSVAEFEWRNKMVNDLLWQEDRVSMAHGIEVRVPFVDVRLAQSVRQHSREYLMPHGQLKGALKTALQPLLPQQIFTRPKSGFQVAARQFFDTQLTLLAQRYLSGDSIRKTGLFNPDFVAQVLAARGGKRLRWHYFMLYLMLTTQLWIELFEQQPQGMPGIDRKSQ
jgi:asparagine synthase (glutamine-hydrolysing)